MKIRYVNACFTPYLSNFNCAIFGIIMLFILLIMKKIKNKKSRELPGGGNILAAGRNAPIWQLNKDNRAAIYFNRVVMHAYYNLTDNDITRALTQ